MTMAETLNVILILFVFITGIAAVRVKDLVSSVFLLGAYSFFLAMLYAVLTAFDVAFTEAMVGVGASTIFLILALFRSKHIVIAQDSGSKNKQPILIFMIILAGFLVWGSADLPHLGDLTSAASQYLSPYYIQNSFHDSHTPNMVTAIVVDYRGFDTLIETAVIFTAGVACLLIVRGES